MKAAAIDPVWENALYSQGHHLNRYPFDAVVSFLMRHRPRDKERAETAVVEVGCGAGNNLWCAAREGFRVAGLDGSLSAINFARDRFAREGLAGEWHVGLFGELPWADASFDLAIDRCSLTCVSHAAQQAAVAEVRRVLRPGGKFFFNGYSDQHTSANSGWRLPDGRVADISAGTLTGAGALYFSTREEIAALFSAGWELLSLEHVSFDQMSGNAGERHTEWRAIVRKI